MSQQSPIRSLCLVRLSALGDVVMTTALVRHLQKTIPGLKITWVIGKAAHPAVAGLEGEGVEFVIIDKPRGLSDYLSLKQRLADRTFDVLLCLQASWRANWIYPCIRAVRKIGYGVDRAKDFHRLFVRETLPPAKPHLVEGFLQFAEVIGASYAENVDWRLPIDQEAQRWADETLPKTPFFAVSPCSSKAERDWPTQRFADVLRGFAGKYPDIPVVVFGGPSARERSFIDEMLSKAGVPVLDLAGKTRVPQLIAALSRCRLLLSPDTAAVHIANAFSRPVVGLYAVAPARRTGPFGHSEFCVDRFDEAVKTLLGRDPASVPWAQRVHDPRAMSLITSESVICMIDLILQKNRA